ncbi:hypothetical protein FOZ61_006250 [Perkinsus olseni]|uniref:Dymeclin n=1 Tax=Perkinsus olseni TaxID=32597 RepID=A0A7J6LE60_PEROL|nr:hypothetical protein FOZ61_006250 [Perkinsus olseni]
MGTTASSTVVATDGMLLPTLNTAAIESAVYTAAGEEISNVTDNTNMWIGEDSNGGHHTIPSTDPYWQLLGIITTGGGGGRTPPEYSICNGLNRLANAVDKGIEMKRLVSNLPRGSGFESLVEVFLKQLDVVLRSKGPPSEGSIAACVALSVILRLAVRVLPAARMPTLHKLSKGSAFIIGCSPSSSLSQDTVGLYSSLFELCMALWGIEDTHNTTEKTNTSGGVLYPYMEDSITTIIDHRLLTTVMILLLRCMISPTLRLRDRAMQIFMIMLHLNPRMRALGSAVFRGADDDDDDDDDDDGEHHQQHEDDEEVDVLVCRVALQLVQEEAAYTPLRLLTLYTLVVRSPVALASLQARTDLADALLPIARAIYRDTASSSSSSSTSGMPRYSSQLSTLKVIILLMMVRQGGCCINASDCWVVDNTVEDAIKHYEMGDDTQQQLGDEEMDVGNREPAAAGVNASSILVLILIRASHWNFAQSKSPIGRDDFLTIAIAATLQNMAKGRGLRHLHWYACQRLLHFTKLIASSSGGVAVAATVYALLRDFPLATPSHHQHPQQLVQCEECLVSMYHKLQAIVDIKDDDDWLDDASLDEVAKYISQCIIQSGAADTGKDALGFMQATKEMPASINRSFQYHENDNDNNDYDTYFGDMVWWAVECSMTSSGQYPSTAAAAAAAAAAGGGGGGGSSSSRAYQLRYICWPVKDASTPSTTSSSSTL